MTTDDGAEGRQHRRGRPDRGADREKLLTAYVSPAGDITMLGLHTDGGAIATTSQRPGPVQHRGLPPNTSFRLLVWNGDGSGENTEVGFVDTDATGWSSSPSRSTPSSP